MLQTSHIERHFTGTAIVCDLVTGLADGLTVPFALAAGLSGVTLRATNLANSPKTARSLSR